jgi:hypothetical protein
MDYELAQERRDRLTSHEIEAIETHVERTRLRSVREDRNVFASGSPEEYRENAFRSVLLSAGYPDNVKQIVGAYERFQDSEEYRLQKQGFEISRF